MQGSVNLGIAETFVYFGTVKVIAVLGEDKKDVKETFETTMKTLFNFKNIVIKAKNILTSAIVLLAIGYILNLLSCGSGGNKTEKQEGKQTVTEGPQSLNISIFLDLSDRLTRSLTPAQMSRDTAIIGNFSMPIIR